MLNYMVWCVFLFFFFSPGVTVWICWEVGLLVLLFFFKIYAGGDLNSC